MFMLNVVKWWTQHSVSVCVSGRRAPKKSVCVNNFQLNFNSVCGSFFILWKKKKTWSNNDSSLHQQTTKKSPEMTHTRFRCFEYSYSLVGSLDEEFDTVCRLLVILQSFSCQRNDSQVDQIWLSTTLLCCGDWKEKTKIEFLVRIVHKVSLVSTTVIWWRMQVNAHFLFILGVFVEQIHGLVVVMRFWTANEPKMNVSHPRPSSKKTQERDRVENVCVYAEKSSITAADPLRQSADKVKNCIVLSRQRR